MVFTGSLWVLLAVSQAANPLRTAEYEVRPRISEEFETRNPELYRLSSEAFRYQMRWLQTDEDSGLRIYEIKFPSARPSRWEVNNTVYATYYEPRRGKGQRMPAVIVLDVLDGRQRVARAQALYLAARGIAAMTLYLPYYGPRRPGNVRFLSPNLEHTREAMGQAVTDVRRAFAILLSRPEIDPEQLGILGTSFGSFVAALSAEMEPAIRRVVLMLGGGGLVEAYYNHPRVAPYRRIWEALGGTKQRLEQLIAPLDPITYASRLRDRQVVILAGKRDEIVPPKAAAALAEAAGAKLIWFDCTHYGAILYFIPAMEICIRQVCRESTVN